MMLEIAPSRRFTIAKALEGVEQTPDLRLALAEWRRQEDHPTVVGVLDRLLGVAPGARVPEDAR